MVREVNRLLSRLSLLRARTVALSISPAIMFLKALGCLPKRLFSLKSVKALCTATERRHAQFLVAP